MRMNTKTNFSCALDPDDKLILRAIRENTGMNWEAFLHHVVEMLKPVRDIEDLINLKNHVKDHVEEWKKDAKSEEH